MKSFVPSNRAGTILLFLALAAIVAAGFFSRLDFLISRGGLEADQIKWAVQNYAGGLSKEYLKIRDAILSWTPEARPWHYFPGYPAFLAILYKVGLRDLASVRLFQIIIDSLAILPLYFVLRRIGRSALPALLGCSIYAIAPWWAAGSTFLLAESVLPAQMIALLTAMVLIRDRAGSSVHWFLLGLLSVTLPLFRSEMLLLFAPLAVWALLVAPKGKRVLSAACVIGGFVLPLVLWAVRNYYIHHQFILAPPATWYAAWSGLGQVANDFGYFVDDIRAIALLKSHGLSYASLEAESFWFREYRDAWIHHPGHVIATILFRFGRIIAWPDIHVATVPRNLLTAYQAMPYITSVALLWLLSMRRWADAFLIALPMCYALGSLGVLYVEPRYVRYVGLTYLLVLPVLDEGLRAVLVRWPDRWRLLEPERARMTIGVVILALVSAGMMHQLVSTTGDAQSVGLVAKLDTNSSKLSASTLDDIVFRPVIPAVEFSRDDAGLHVQARVPAGPYLLVASVGTESNQAVIVRYRVTLLRGALGLGVLSGDSTRWLAHATLAGAPGRVMTGQFVGPAEVGSQFVLDAQGVDGETDVVVNSLELTLACFEPVGVLQLFLHTATVPARPCDASRRIEEQSRS